jgi:predicted transcriptional regulator
MSIFISLSPEVEARLREKAAQQGQDVSLVAAELLARILEWELQDSEEAVAGIQRGLDDFEAGRSRSFQEFAEEQRHQYNLPIDS